MCELLLTQVLLWTRGVQLFSGVVTRVVLPHQVVWTLHLEAVPMRAALYEVVRFLKQNFDCLYLYPIKYNISTMVQVGNVAQKESKDDDTAAFINASLEPNQ